MFEKILYDYLEEEKVVPFILILTFVLAVITGFTYYTKLDMMFAVVFFSITLTYPVVRFLTERNSLEFSSKISEKKLMFRHAEELFFFLLVLVITSFFTYLGFWLGIEGSFQQAVVGAISGFVTFGGEGFVSILLNNLNVLFLTFVLGLIFRSAFVFIVTWNASIIGYYLYSLGSPLMTFTTSLSLLAHGLFEVAGYILVGFSAFLFSLKTENESKKYSSQVTKDMIYLFLFGVLCVLIGAFIEVL